MDVGANTPMRPSDEPTTLMRSVRLLLIVAVFAVVGPMVGTVVVAITLGTMIDAANLNIVALAWDRGGAYVVGGVPAVIAGGLIGIRHAWFGGAGWWFALATGLLVGAGLDYLMHRLLILEGGPLGLFTAAATLATLACWRIVETWSFPREANP